MTLIPRPWSNYYKENVPCDSADLKVACVDLESMAWIQKPNLIIGLSRRMAAMFAGHLAP
jgi:hypothetical protein